jgi:hypothetical protein
MSRNDDHQPKNSPAPADASSAKVGQSIQLPRPTQDQQDYLEQIKLSTGRYDPNVVVGGPRRPAV